MEVDAADDQPVFAEGRLGQLADAAVGVVGHRLPGVVGDLGNPLGGELVFGDADRVATAALAQSGADLVVVEARVGADQDLARGAGPADAREQLVDEPQRAALGVGLALAQPDVQDLVAVGAGGQQRVVAQAAGIAVAGALLGVAVDLADEGGR